MPELKAIRPPPRNVNTKQADVTTPLRHALRQAQEGPQDVALAPTSTGDMLRAIGIRPSNDVQLGSVPLDTIPDPPAAPELPAQPSPPRAFRFSVDIRFKGRVITVYADGMTLSEFSALLDAHGFAPVDGES